MSVLGFFLKLCVDSSGSSGGLAFFWNTKACISLEYFLKGHVEVIVQPPDNVTWCLTDFMDTFVRILGTNRGCCVWVILKK